MDCTRCHAELPQGANFCPRCGKQIPDCESKTRTKFDEPFEWERDGERDPLFDDAVQLAVEKGQLSTSILQRNLRLGYARAAKLIDQLEQEKIIGPYEGDHPRQVLIPHNEPEDAAQQSEQKDVVRQSAEICNPPPLAVQKPIYAPAKPNKKKKRSRVSIYQLDYMDGHDFEIVCAKILQSNGFSDVEVTKASGDYGIDILARKSGVRYAIQCKCYSSPVGNHAVQEAYSGAAYYGGRIPVVLTNQTFTPAAIETANAIGVQLWGRDKLESMLSAYNQIPTSELAGRAILRFLFAELSSAVATILTVLCVYREITENLPSTMFEFSRILASIICCWILFKIVSKWILKMFTKR